MRPDECTKAADATAVTITTNAYLRPRGDEVPRPSVVVLRSETDSITASNAISSPGCSDRTYSCSQSVATTEV